jgi:hypothetical protein
MIPLLEKATPFAWQVPDQTYEKFKEWQHCVVNPQLWSHLQPEIEAHAQSVVESFFASIEKWKTETREEISIYERLEEARNQAKEVFA